MLTYWFYPNPGNASYDNPKVLLIFGVCAVLFLASFAISSWRKRQGGVTRNLSRSWAPVCRWLAIIGAFLVLCRVEEIQFMSMRFLWLLWALTLIAFVLFQIWWFKKKNYTVVAKERTTDPREAYLPQEARKNLR